jgi:hypothetical protein
MRHAITARQSPEVFFETLAAQLHKQGINASVNKDSLLIGSMGGRNKGWDNALRRLGWNVTKHDAGWPGYTAVRDDNTHQMEIRNARGAWLLVLV